LQTKERPTSAKVSVGKTEGQLARKEIAMNTPPTIAGPHADDFATSAWRLDPTCSSVEFHVPHFWGLVTVKGHFESYQGRLDLGAYPAIELTIEATSLVTGNPKRDRHLRSADFFDAERHPCVRFLSDFVALDGDILRVGGRLHARGSEIPLELDVRIDQVDGELEIEATTNAPHRDLGMTWNRLGVIGSHSRLLVKGRLTQTGGQQLASAAAKTAKGQGSARHP
jgi:polyisoprenoid-binding protein YceI